MSWSRAVWKEELKTVEGVVPSVWIVDNMVCWPRKNEKSAALEKAKPSNDWKQFPLMKVKVTSGNYVD
jgi:hypothetical protein